MSSHQPIVSPETLSVPHFDEEATLLSARPVVPLHEVRAETRSKRRLVFALSIVMAILVGGIGASLFFMPDDKSKTSVTQDTFTNSADSSQPTDGGSLKDTAGSSPAGQTVSSAESASLTNEQADQRPSSAPKSLKSNVSRVPAPRTSSTVRPTRAYPEPSRSAQVGSTVENDAENLEMDEKRLRREERREARRLRRERRISREPSSEDLMRIREIFEGVPRP